MRNKIYTLVALMMATLTITSCLKDDDEKESVSYKDTAILSFSLGQMAQVRDTIAKNGSDSVYTAKFNAAKVKFYIDQAQGLIYNPDSLPYGTKSSSVLAKIVAKNSGIVVLKSTTEEKFTYYNSNDSIDFSTPRVLRVYSNKGSEYRDYKVTVNVHKQKGNVFSWETLQANSNFASFTAMKAVSTGSKVFVFGTNGSQTVVYAAAKDNGNSWTKLNKTFAADAYKSVVTQGDKLFVIDNGAVYSSTEGNTWTTVTTNSSLKQLVAASPVELFALSNTGSLLSSKDNGATWTAESLDSSTSLLPTSNINYSYTTITSNLYSVLLVGKPASGTHNTSWTKVLIDQASSGIMLRVMRISSSCLFIRTLQLSTMTGQPLPWVSTIVIRWFLCSSLVIVVSLGKPTRTLLIQKTCRQVLLSQLLSIATNTSGLSAVQRFGVEDSIV